MHDKNSYLTELPFYDNLSAAEKITIQENSSIKTVKSGEVIYGCNQQCLGLVQIIEGEISARLTSDEGREISLFRIYEKEYCVLTASCVINQITFQTQMVAVKDCTFLVVGAAACSALSKANVYVRCFVYELLTDRFSSVMFTMQEILFKGFDKRLARFLLEEYYRTGNDELNMTHEQIAKDTSSAREVVARMLKRFSADKLVSYERGKIKILSVKGLEALL